jgi:hypothetical protein
MNYLKRWPLPLVNMMIMDSNWRNDTPLYTIVACFIDALVGNTTIDNLNICSNRITFAGFADITRLLETSQLETIKTQLQRRHVQ